ncbi:MAG TPA: His/Gly/Thr/Pro-type tRNA ligase C-terminal domain-containing protein, partial [Candidatus Angelobacter sp.]|nr:His/Gly/Thr/Pro-type tRNA ligase C-terminal domain-containing protein [Candidatus Angelobacter sp.]
RIISLLTKEDLNRLLQGKKPGDSIRVDSHEVPVEFFETKEETVKEAGTKFLPHVIEPSFGVERLVYSTLEHNLRMKDERLILSLPFGIAPIQAAVYPLVSKDGLVEKAHSVHQSLLQTGLRIEYDDAGSIGRRYARADEAGIPLGITVDYDTLKDGSVTLRDRDSWNQVRVQIGDLKPTIDSIVSNGFPAKTS